MIYKKDKLSQQGNVMVYILIALALIGFLTLTLSRQNDQSDSQSISDEQVTLYVQELINYVSTAQSSVDMMLAGSSDVSDLDIVLPTDANFDTGSPIHKIFHPLGGGLSYQESFPSAIENGANAGWRITNDMNVFWTESNAHDVILTAYFINRQVCERINSLITGSTTIPATDQEHEEYFGGSVDLDPTDCPDCEGYPSLCVENNTGDGYSFYSILASQ